MTGLPEALSIGPGDIVALVGAGGKTTAMFSCAAELRRAGGAAVITTTTRIFVPDASSELGPVVERDRDRAMARTRAELAGGRIPVVGTAITNDAKLTGVPPSWVADLAGLPGVHCVLVESDGSARLPITAPREDEPVIPPSATVVVVVVGVDALGGRIEHVAHRPELLGELAELPRTATLDARAIARVMLDPRGNTQGAPGHARVVALINKADDERTIADARAIARALREIRAVRVVIASLRHAGVREVIG